MKTDSKHQVIQLSIEAFQEIEAKLPPEYRVAHPDHFPSLAFYTPFGDTVLFEPDKK